MVRNFAWITSAVTSQNIESAFPPTQYHSNDSKCSSYMACNDLRFKKVAWRDRIVELLSASVKELSSPSLHVQYWFTGQHQAIIYFALARLEWMHHLILQQRFRDSILAINDTLTGMALDPRLMPGVASDMRLRSSASTPSLRSREGSVTPMGRMDAPGGNVRVVVRVRGFLPRGKEIV